MWRGSTLQNYEIMTKVQNDLSGVSAEARAQAQRHYEQGRRYWSEGRHGDAMTEYNRAAALDPQSPAVTALRMADDIMDFFDHDRFNP